MLGKKAWQARQILPHQTQQTMFSWTLLCELVCSHAGTERGLLQTGPTVLEAIDQNNLLHLGKLKHEDSLERTGLALPLKNNLITSSLLQIKRCVQIPKHFNSVKIDDSTDVLNKGA